MTRAGLRALGLAAYCVGGCGDQAAAPRGQVLLYVDTDALLPGAADGAGGAALFDRLRIEITPPGGDPAATQTNEFDITTAMVAAQRASVGIQTPPGANGYKARLRMFRTAFASATGEPDADSTVDVTIALPAVGTTGIVELTATLRTDDVGVPVGAGEPAAPAPGPPSGSLVGSWPGAARVGCSSMGRPGEVCIPGGAFWMGSTAAEIPHDAGALFLRPRLVTLSPFWLADREVTVGAARAGAVKPIPWSGSSAGNAFDDWCTFTSAPGPNDTRPLNCVNWSAARAYCQSIGADLPTEAQFEYVAGALEDRRFVWGQENPACADSVWGLAGAGFYGYALPVCGSARPGQAPLAVDPMRSGRDRFVAPAGGTVLDLAGNLGEWALDLWNAPDEPCWQRPGVYADPVCGQPSPSMGTNYTLRGGGWLDSGDLLLATERDIGGAQSADDPTIGPTTGFRCARPDAQ